MRALTLIGGVPVDPTNGWAVRHAPGDGTEIGEFPRSGAPEVD